MVPPLATARCPNHHNLYEPVPSHSWVAPCGRLPTFLPCSSLTPFGFGDFFGKHEKKHGNTLEVEVVK